MFGFARRSLRKALFASFAVLLTITLGDYAAAQSDAMPSWNDGTVKGAIMEFVARVTAQGGAEFVPPAERIAVFDNDGTLWCEQPVYFQAAFALDQVKAMAPQHPEWKQQPFKAFLSHDKDALAAQGEKGLPMLVAAAPRDRFRRRLHLFQSTNRQRILLGRGPHLQFQEHRHAIPERDGLPHRLGRIAFRHQHVQLGLVGYYLQQVTDDFGAPAALGGFRSRVAGVGPQVGFLFPIGGMQGYLNPKGYWEFAAQNRPEGWNTWVTFAISPAAPELASTKPVVRKY
jgi:hypothetical protein